MCICTSDELPDCFIYAFNETANKAHENAKDKGFWDDPREDGTLIALMHSELSEALEALRKDDGANLAEELADTIIRIMDFSVARKLNIGEAIISKMNINKARSRKHGKNF